MTTQPIVNAHNKADGLEKEFFDLGLNRDNYQIFVGLIDATQSQEKVQFLVQSPQGKLEFFPKYYLADILKTTHGLMLYGDFPQWEVTANQMQTAVWWLRQQLRVD